MSYSTPLEETVIMTEKWLKRFLEMAQLVSTWSKDPSTQVGAVIINDNRIILGTGYNGFPRKVADLPSRYQNREEKYPRVIHAEVNAVLNANGSVKKGTLFTYPFPCCASCSAMMIQAGIKHVVSPDHIPERWRDSVEMGISMYREADVKVTLL
jgi:deoxycytidylate deaminase